MTPNSQAIKKATSREVTFVIDGGPDGRQTQVKYYPMYPYNNRQCSAIAAYQNIDLPLLSCTILLHMVIQM